MPDNSAFGPPILNPTDENMQSWQDMQRKQMLAQMLMQNMQTSGQTPDNWDSMRVVPHRGLLQNLAPIASALLAGKAMKGSQAAQQSYLQKKYSDQPPMQPQASNGQPGGTAQQSPGLLPQQPQNPMLAPGVSRARSQQLMDLMGESEYGKGVVLPQLMGSPEWQTALRANGGDAQAAQAALKAELTKKGTLERRSGGEADIPDPTAPGGFRTVRTPNMPAGFDYERDAQGNISGAHPIPGMIPGQQALATATETGKNQGDIHTIPTAGGGTKVQFGIGGIPGAPAQPGAPKSYFPQQNGADTSATGHEAPPGVTPGIWRGTPMRPNTQGGYGEDPYLKGQIGGMVKKNDELSDKYGSESDLADQRIAFNNEALKVLGGSLTGPLSEKMTDMASKAHELFGDHLPSWIPDTKTINNSTELKKFLLRNPLLSLKPTFGGRPAASEFQVLANDASPSPKMLQGSIERLVQLDNQAAGFSKQRAADYGFYHDQVKGNPLRFESWYSNKVPFAKWLDENPLGRPGEARVSSSAAPSGIALTDLEAEMKRRGHIK